MHQVQLGSATVEVDGDTVFVLRQAAWTSANVGAFLAVLEDVRTTHGRVFLVNDLSAGLSVSADARKRIAAWLRAHNPEARVMIGATIAARAAILLLTRGAQLLSGNTTPTHFVDTRQEAVEIIARERARLQSATGKMPRVSR